MNVGSGVLSRLQEVDFIFLIFPSFLFSFQVTSHFSIFRILGVRVRSDWSHCHICHKSDSVVIKGIIRLGRTK